MSPNPSQLFLELVRAEISITFDGGEKLNAKLFDGNIARCEQVAVLSNGTR